MVVQTRAARIHDLDLQHHTLIHQTSLVVKDEEGRRFKLRLLQLRDEIATLRERLAHKDNSVRTLSDHADRVRAELDTARQAGRAHEARLKTQMRDMAALQAELKALSHVSQESSRTLAEKLTLGCELDALRPELDHLRSLQSHQKSVVAEKLALERQVNTLEVELEAEKRAKSRTPKRQDNKPLDDGQRRLAEVEAQLLAQRKAAEKADKIHERDLSEAGAENERLRDRIDTLKAKLHSAQDQLKLLRSELASARQAGPKKSKKVRLELVTKQQRNVTATLDTALWDSDVENTAVARIPQKRGGLDLTLVGEKSNFSITPFLNRTKTFCDESSHLDPPSPINQRSADTANMVDETTAGLICSPPPVNDSRLVEAPPQSQGIPKPRARAKAKPLAAASSSKINITTAAAARIRRPKPLEKVVEEEPAGTGYGLVEAQASCEPNAEVDSKPTACAASGTGDLNQRTKKRKLHGDAAQNVYADGDGNGGGSGGAVPPLQAARKLAKASLGLASRPTAFAGAAFSPLKRDRRGINASFLT